MKFTPNYTVSYHGEFHKAGIPFDIEDKDVKEMSAHGVISGDKTSRAEDATDETGIRDGEQPRRGRSKRDD